MNKLFFRPVLMSVVAASFYFIGYYLLGLDSHIIDSSSLGAYITALSTIYGVVIGFTVVEVWNQNTQVQTLVEEEAKSLENFRHLVEFLQNKKLTADVHTAIQNYLQIVIQDKFTKVGQGHENPEATEAFLKIGILLRNIKFDNNHDQTIFGALFKIYAGLRTTITSRESISLARMPVPLNMFLYLGSGILIFSFMIMPFQNLIYGMLSAALLTALVTFLHAIINDLDNPFVGFWNISPNPYETVYNTLSEK